MTSIVFHLFLDPLPTPRVELSRLCARCGSLIPKSDRLGNMEGVCAACREDRS
jgi:hypothetical protein